MSPRRWTGGLLLATALAALGPLAVYGNATEETDNPPSTAAVPLDELAVTSTQVASGLERPTAIAAPDDDTGRLFITEKPGTVRVYNPDTGLAERPLLSIAGSVDYSENERGLLGIAVPPDFADSQELYLSYTRRSDSAVTLARYSLADDSREVLLTQPHAEYGNHNGGNLAFDADGLLYWGIGDGGGSGDPFDSGQRVDTLLGKIMRIDVSATCGELPYCIPEDNPLVGVEGAREEIWTYGLRNPWRFSFDPADNSLWIGDVGQGSEEEIDHLAPGQGGANLGWSCREGAEEFDPEQCPQDSSELVEPVHTYPLSGGNCSVIGGLVYRGQQYADLAEGTYLASDYCGATAIAIRPNADGGYATAEIGEFETQPTAFGATVDGELYYVNDLPGGLHQVEFQQAGGAG